MKGIYFSAFRNQSEMFGIAWHHLCIKVCINWVQQNVSYPPISSLASYPGLLTSGCSTASDKRWGEKARVRGHKQPGTGLAVTNTMADYDEVYSCFLEKKSIPQEIHSFSYAPTSCSHSSQTSNSHDQIQSWEVKKYYKAFHRKSIHSATHPQAVVIAHKLQTVMVRYNLGR